MLNEEEFSSTVTFLRNAYPDKPGLVKQLAESQMRFEFANVVRPEFLKAIGKCRQTEGPYFIENFAKAIDFLNEHVVKYFAAELRNDSFIELKAVVLHTFSDELLDVLDTFYDRWFSMFSILEKRAANSLNKRRSTELPDCSICLKRPLKCTCSGLLDKCAKVNDQIYELDLIDRLAGTVIPNILQSAVEEAIREAGQGSTQQAHLKDLLAWLDDIVFKWLTIVYEQDANCPKVQPATTSSYKAQTTRIRYIVYDLYARLLTDKLFEIIVEYPSSDPAIKDLKQCLEYVSLKSHIVKTLKQTIERRLLRPAVNTEEILTVYTDAIKALRALDSTGAILESVCEPIRQYLRQRADTVRCIVSRLTDNETDLNQDLMRDESLVVLDESFRPEEEPSDWRDWMPEPIDSEVTSKHTRGRKTADMVSMLVGIYGSKELFVKEYCSLLAERLLKNLSFEVDKEHRNLEMLKLRFGETELHQCEVMLRDIDESKRITANIKSSDFQKPAVKRLADEAENRQALSPSPVSVEALILSAQFWPSLKEDKLVLPRAVQLGLDNFCKRFESLKVSRTLEWKPQFGSVELELQLNGQKKQFTVSPIHACVIAAFEDKATWSLEELSAHLCVSSNVLRRRIRFWQRCGVLRENTRDHWTLTSSLPAFLQRGEAHSLYADAEGDELESMVADGGDKTEELQTYWAYIKGILGNLESLTAERIHSLLKMFVTDGEDGFTLEQIQKFLELKVKDQQLIMVSGVYKLPKNK